MQRNTYLKKQRNQFAVDFGSCHCCCFAVTVTTVAVNDDIVDTPAATVDILFLPLILFVFLLLMFFLLLLVMLPITDVAVDSCTAAAAVNVTAVNAAITNTAAAAAIND